MHYETIAILSFSFIELKKYLVVSKGLRVAVVHRIFYFLTKLEERSTNLGKVVWS